MHAAHQVRFLAWLEDNLSKEQEVPEYKGSARLTRSARLENNVNCFSHKHISASGPNAVLPCHSPKKSLVRMIRLHGPYLMYASQSLLSSLSYLISVEQVCTIKMVYVKQPGLR